MHTWRRWPSSTKPSSIRTTATSRGFLVFAGPIRFSRLSPHHRRQPRRAHLTVEIADLAVAERLPFRERGVEPLLVEIEGLALRRGGSVVGPFQVGRQRREDGGDRGEVVLSARGAPPGAPRGLEARDVGRDALRRLPQRGRARTAAELAVQGLEPRRDLLDLFLG